MIDRVRASRQPSDQEPGAALDHRVAIGARESSIRNCLLDLLEQVPDGDSDGALSQLRRCGLEIDLYEALIRGGFIPGQVDREGHLLKCDLPAARAYVRRLLETLGSR
ncbi:hypothetical protein [Caldimonas tepidiphila]|uniref:hypothetical protein n=1 Tax=Caldimonas tepidiphila TaxID=2315841 RepID=UPI000E5A2A59|nr:hypothetical protein [Caldimonas tepidiphila]